MFPTMSNRKQEKILPCNWVESIRQCTTYCTYRLLTVLASRFFVVVINMKYPSLIETVSGSSHFTSRSSSLFRLVVKQQLVAAIAYSCSPSNFKHNKLHYRHHAEYCDTGYQLWPTVRVYKDLLRGYHQPIL